MSPVRCPDGHTSESTDYCDVCGAPIGSSSSPAAAPPAPVAPTTCPHCGSPAAGGALFCENCGYDFTTGATPVAAAGSAPAPSTPASSAPVSSLDLGGPATSPHGTPAVGGASTDGSGTASDPSSSSSPRPTPDPADPADPALAPPPAGATTWVAELWVDPDWYAAQQAEDPMPSVGLPVLIPLRERSVLVGRPSASRNIRPQVDAGADSGVSRRHCQLNTDGQRWWVEDLQSSNGTYVARVGESLPDTPIPPGQRHELEDGDRLYLGSWTRLVVRRALPGEA